MKGRAFKMSAFTIFLFSILFLVALFMVLNNLFNSRWFRIALINLQQKRNEEQIKEEQQEIRQQAAQEVENPDQMLETILKIKRGEEVKIPLVAFDYIYRNLDKYTIVDKQGKLTFVNREDYFKFKKHYEFLISENTEDGEIDVRSIVKNMINSNAKTPIEVTKHEDGTVVKMDHVEHTVEILKPNGERIFVDLKSDKMISESLVEDEEKKVSNKDKKELEKKQKAEMHEKKLSDDKNRKIERENTQLKEELDKYKQIGVFDKKEVEDIAVKADKNQAETLDSNKEQLSSSTKVKNENNSNVAIQDLVENESDYEEDPFFIDDVDIEEELKNENKLEYKLENKKLDNNTKINIEISDNNPESPSDFYFSFINSNNFLETQITHDRVLLLLHYILTYNKINAQQCVIYDSKTDGILIDLNWFAYKIWYLIILKNERETFLKEFYENKDMGIVNNEFLSNIIKKFNNMTSLLIGSKVFYQEEISEKTLNFKLIKIEDIDGILHQGLYLHLFSNNSFGKKFKESVEFHNIANNGCAVCENKNKGKKRSFVNITSLRHL